MPTPIEELRTGVEYVAAELRTIHEAAEGRALDADEQARFDAGQAYITETRALIERHNDVARLSEIPEAVEHNDAARFEAPGVIVRDENPYDLSDVRMGDTQALRSKALRAIERDGVMLDRHQEEAERVVRSLDPSIAARVAVTSSPAYGSAFVKAVSGREHLFTSEEREAVARAATLGGTAGYAVPTPIDTTIIDTGTHSTNPFRQISTIKKITGTNWTGVSSAGVTASWDGESAEVSDDAPTLAQPQIPTFKGAAFVPFSLEAEDWSSMASDVYQMITVAKDDLEGAAFVSGNGTSAPQGVTVALDGGSREIAPTVAETFTPKADLDKLFASVQARFRRNASVVANYVWINGIRAAETTVNVGDLVSRMPVDISGDWSVAGYPAYESSDMDAVLPVASADADNFGILFGDFAQGYYIVDRVGLNVELIPHLFHTSNNLPKGQRGFYAWFRTGAEVVNPAALAMLSIPTAA
ncbi:MAG: phage major capsid protein [Microthrixaceae bacterium]|nr:phage major capsid protein [Microthrixaceae bacterium]